MTRREPWMLALIAAPLLGVVDAAIYIAKGPSNTACIGAENACEFSYILGWVTLPVLGRVHLSWLALAYFTLQAFLSLLIALRPALTALKASLTLYLAGTALIPYLAYMQVSKINGICLYCTAMYAFIVTGLASSLILIKRYKLTI